MKKAKKLILGLVILVGMLFASNIASAVPSYSLVTPATGSTDLGTSLTFYVHMYELNGTFNWTIECTSGDRSTANAESNGTKALTMTGLSYKTSYTVYVNATQDNSTTRESTYTFRTKDTEDGGHGSDVYVPPAQIDDTDTTTEVEEEVVTELPALGISFLLNLLFLGFLIFRKFPYRLPWVIGVFWLVLNVVLLAIAQSI